MWLNKPNLRKVVNILALALVIVSLWFAVVLVTVGQLALPQIVSDKEKWVVYTSTLHNYQIEYSSYWSERFYGTVGTTGSPKLHAVFDESSFSGSADATVWVFHNTRLHDKPATDWGDEIIRQLFGYGSSEWVAIALKHHTALSKPFSTRSREGNAYLITVNQNEAYVIAYTIDHRTLNTAITEKRVNRMVNSFRILNAPN